MEGGKLILMIGAVLVVIGAVLTWAPGLVNWFGRLPGDIRIEKEGSGFYFPVTSMIIISVVLSVIMNLLGRK